MALINNEKVQTAKALEKSMTSDMTLKEKFLYKIQSKTTWTALGLFGYFVVTQNWGGAFTQVITLFGGN